jgi:tetratricopeptide (TPR) repeat protein
VAGTAPARESKRNLEKEFMKEPTTPEELMALQDIRRSDPHRYLDITNRWIRDNPKSPHPYFSRHHAWLKLGEPRRALDDLDRSIALENEPDALSFLARGQVHRQLGEYDKALMDFDRGEALDPKKWERDIVFGLLFQADAHARLGNEVAALSYCARLPADFWTPGIEGAPGGEKAQIANELRRLAGEARLRRE